MAERELTRPANTLRRDLELAGERRKRAEEARDQVTDDIRTLLKEVAEHPEISQTQAAELLGISRTGAWKLIRKEGT